MFVLGIVPIQIDDLTFFRGTCVHSEVSLALQSMQSHGCTPCPPPPPGGKTKFVCITLDLGHTHQRPRVLFGLTIAPAARIWAAACYLTRNQAAAIPEDKHIIQIH